MLVVPRRRQEGRRAVILMVVLMLLTLFTLLGLAFVLLADSYATSARIAREDETRLQPEIDPELALNLVLAQLIYDVPDDPTGIGSALRGQSLARNMFGWNDAPYAANDKAYAGMGRLRYPSTAFPAVSDFDLLNYQFFATDGWVRDPERLGSRTPSQPRNLYVAGNVPYTYVDNNNAFLAYLNYAANTIDVPSFHRPWVFNLDPSTGKPLANPPAFNDPNHPNWTSPAGKYLTLRPRPAEMGPGFPYPLDAHGDVKNYDGGPGGCDSIWIDINSAVMRSPDGRKYKMLVAPLIVELDSRLNLNVHGNILGRNNTHGGNQGWGPWEVNLGKVLTAAQTGAGPAQEWGNLFLGSPTTGRIQGRYGRGGLPVSPGGFPPAVARPSPRGWGATDENGIVDPVSQFGPAPTPASRRNPTPAYSLPATFGPAFPAFPSSGYNNGYPIEYTAAGVLNHPRLYDPVHPATGNRAFSVSDTVKLLRYGGTNYEFLGSDLLRLCPTNFSTASIRNLVTTASFDLDRPAPVPYAWDMAAAPYTLGGVYPYSLKQADITAPFAPNSFPALDAARKGLLPTFTEFDPNWRSLLAELDRIDLNRPLAAYPDPDPTTGLIAAAKMVQYGKAVQDRQNLARDIFDVLRQAVGARPPTAGVSAGELNALRALAQIAVNIVDFIDSDDISTPFNWFRSEWVFGVELPRLVLNEVYVQYDNDPDDPDIQPGGTSPLGMRASTHYNVNVWAELLNPLDGRKDPLYNGRVPGSANKDVEARLTSAAGPIYQVVIADALVSSATLLQPANVTGDPDFSLGSGPSRVRAVASDFGPNAVVKPVDGTYSIPANSRNGFFVLGPNVGFVAGENPNLPTSHVSTGMSYQVPVTAFGSKKPPQPTILLRRLACPGLPYQPSAKLPLYNPFLTVDYVEKTTSASGNDARQYNNLGRNQPQPLTSRQAMGRTQPYAADGGHLVPQQPLARAANQPQHTFFRHNGQTAVPPAKSDATLTVPFDWLVHLDRAPIGKAELLYVAGCKPHELTHLFANAAGANQHAAPWLDPTTRLYRFFEFAGGFARPGAAAVGGRVPGRININMVFAPEIFRAICDAQPGNLYNQAQVDQLFQQLLDYRTPPKTDPTGKTTNFPGAGDQPFLGFGAGPAPGNDALSIAARGITNQLPGLGAANANPYQRFEVLNKLSNNLTTRSNVFAVWVTVGFFEVVDETTTPPKLGAEIGRSENRQIRHRMFAVVDRTNLQVFATTSTAAIAATQSGTTIPIQLTQTSGIVAHSGFQWQVQAGSVLVYQPDDPLGNEETVVVKTGNTATFTKSHPAGCAVIGRGNPGPWTLQPYDAAQDAAVVPYFAVIE